MSEKIATREAYGKALVELGASNDKIVVLDADLAGATMTKFFKAAYPDRFFDCGIAECNMMDVAQACPPRDSFPSAPPLLCSVQAGPMSRSATPSPTPVSM